MNNVAKFCEWGGLAGPVAKVVEPYESFVARKKTLVKPFGFEAKESDLNDKLFDWQKRIVAWALRRGRAAIFAECGLGKSFMQLEWASQVCLHTKRPVVIHCPIGVRHQTLGEAEKFGIASRVAVVDEQAERIDGINLINYEKAHKFDFSDCAGVVLDESSVLKSIDGKTRNLLTAAWSHANYKLPCTATPAPNDHMELGNHAEFLGVCQALDMLSKYFVHDSGDTSKWRLRKHAVDDFWRWVASWAVCIGKPSDINGDDTGFDLPEMIVERHHVDVEGRQAAFGLLFDTGGISATNIHAERKVSNEARCRKAAEIANATDDYCIIWCDTNYEADLLQELLPDATEIRGQETDRVKEQKLADFSAGRVRVLISKPSIAGFGMNWQHCCNLIFAGLSYSFERYYQAVRRCYRFGQQRSVHVHIILSDTDSSVSSAIARKSTDFDAMRSGMSEAMRAGTLEEFGLDNQKKSFVKRYKLDLPEWVNNVTS